MANTCQSQTFYRPLLNRQTTDQSISLIIVCVFIPLQFILMIFIFLKGYKTLKKIVFEKQLQIQEKGITERQKSDKIKQGQQKIEENAKNKLDNEIPSQNKQGIIHRILYQNSSKLKIFTAMVLFFLLFVLGLILLTMAFLAIFQIAQQAYPQTQCNLTNKVNEFRKGSEKWIGLQNLVPNITQLNLILNTRIQVSINAIRGLMLNGTVAAIKPGLGFANGTNITVINKISPLNRTFVIANSVKSNINASVRYWLFMNSSLSGTTLFPVCQPNLTYPIQHPLMTGKTIELNYMDQICQKATKEVDDLVENGAKVDQLLVDLQDTKVRKTNLESNLTALSQIYSSISSRTKEYASQFSSFGHNFETVSLLSILALASYGGVGILMTVYLIFLLGINCCTYSQKEQKEQLDGQSSVDIIGTTREGQHKNSSAKNNGRLSHLSSFFPKFFLILLIGVNIISGIGSSLLVKKSMEITQNCQKFDQARTDTDFFNSLSLTSSQKELLAPIHECTSGKTTYFMQSVPLITSRQSLQKLYSLSDTYNKSVPKNVFNSESLTQVQTLKQYLFHLETMPIKSQQFNLLQILNQINLYSNGSYKGSKQLEDCGKAVIQDQYVYNAVDCKHKLMDLVTEVTVTEPRCIILPTYDGTPGTVTTHLNEAQHTFVLNATCPSINNMFSQTNSSCFLGKRLSILQTQNCTKTATELGTRLENLVKFSQQASTYTDIYMQNLRNLFGIYATSSTNLTQFFAGTNMSQTMGAFGVLSYNLLNRTKCDQVKPIVDAIYEAYCHKDNSMPKLFWEANLWTIIVVITIFIQSIVFFLLDLFLRVYCIERHFGKTKQESIGKKILPINHQNNIIEVSQETLVRDNIFENDRIYQDEFNNLHLSPSAEIKNPIVIITENAEPHRQIKPKYQNSPTLDETNFLFDKYSPSPAKSINPYGNFVDSSEIINYPELHETPLKQDTKKKEPSIPEKKQNFDQINLLSSIKKTNLIQNQIFNEEDSSGEEKKPDQIKESIPRESHQRQGKLMMSQTTRRFKKVSVETDEKKIMPQLVFNLEEEKQADKKSPKLTNRIRTNVKTQNLREVQSNDVISGRSQSFLEINLHDSDQIQNQDSKDIEAINLERIKKQRQNRERLKQQNQGKKESITAR